MTIFKLFLACLFVIIFGLKIGKAEIRIPSELTLDLGTDFQFFFDGDVTEGFLSFPPALLELQKDKDMEVPPDARQVYNAKISGANYSLKDDAPTYLSLMRISHDLFLTQASTDPLECRNYNSEICYMSVFQVVDDNSIIYKNISCDAAQRFFISQLFPEWSCEYLSSITPNDSTLNFTERACAFTLLARLEKGKIVGKILVSKKLNELPAAPDFCEQVYNKRDEVSQYKITFNKSGVFVSEGVSTEVKYKIFFPNTKFEFGKIYDRLLENPDSPFRYKSTIRAKSDGGSYSSRTLELTAVNGTEVFTINLNDDMREYWVKSSGNFTVEDGFSEGQSIAENSEEIKDCGIEEESLVCTSRNKSIVYLASISEKCGEAVFDDIYQNGEWKKHRECIYVYGVTWFP